ncbi:MAG: Gram-negative bacterial TonB protein C-terminal [Thermoanaerobaculia bacterium]|nr:Gram-negative bacterial TonB protein C-terminal [Thermoanaerobaculia bacterium]
MKRTVIALLLLAIPLFADAIDDWRRDQTAIEAMLEQKHYADARKASIKLTNRMFDRLGPNADASKMLAKTVALRAAAEDGLGNVDDTNWYRQVAKELDPQVVLPPMTTPVPEPVATLHVGLPPADATAAPVLAPQRTRKRDPERPAIVNALGQASVELEVAIDVDGMVRQPRIISSPAPSVSYAALEAIKQWRFRPGTMEGKPVPVIFHITFTFH